MSIHSPQLVRFFCISLIVAVISCAAFGRGSEDEADKRNSLLNLAETLNFQNGHAPGHFCTSANASGFILRAMLPGTTRPDLKGGFTTGLGDNNVFVIFLLSRLGRQIGMESLLAMPSVINPGHGTGEWRAGLAASAASAFEARLPGVLVQWHRG